MTEQQAKQLRPGDHVVVNGRAGTFVDWLITRSVPRYRIALVRVGSDIDATGVNVAALETAEAEAA